MTAEIAILNRTAVTLAADSAVTLTVRGRRKIYQSVDKIFELSLDNPIALMIWNNLEYHRIPLDIIIRQFRASISCRNFQTLFECADAFLDYLKSNVSIPDKIANAHVFGIVIDEFNSLREKTFEALFDTIKERGNEEVNPKEVFLRIADERIKELESLPVSDCFSDVNLSFIIDAHKNVLDAAAGHVLGTEDNEDSQDNEDPRLERLRQLGALFLHRDIFSDKMTGLVFAGFGGNELFPSLQAVEIDGVIAGRLKQKLTHKTDIDRENRRNGGVEKRLVQIIPFAQTDMAERFLDGIDPRLEREIVRSVERAHQTALEQFRTSHPELDQEVANKAADLFATYLNETLKHFKDDALANHKAALREEIEDMALMMPKQELAFLAEAIINLTSIKRKVSGEEESVAGPIDVAIISKSDGLIWVKRKHYFDIQFNPRYLERIRAAITKRQRSTSHAEALDGDGATTAPDSSHGLRPAPKRPRSRGRSSHPG